MGAIGFVVGFSASAGAEGEAPAYSPAAEEGDGRGPMVAWPQGAARDASEPASRTDADGARASEERKADASERDIKTAPEPPPPTPPPLPAGAERPLPDYDGREEPTTAGDVLIWVPRVLLSPLYLVSEYVVRRPLGFVATTAEKNEWPTLLLDFFTFGEDRRAGIVPTALIDFGLRASVGIYAFWDRAFFEENALRARLAWGGEHWYSASLTDRVTLSPDHEIAVRGAFLQRPDYVFHGIGPSSRQEDRSRFQQRQIDGSVRYRQRLPASSWLEMDAGIRHADFDPTITCCEEPPVATLVAQGRYPLPPRVDGSLTVAYQEARLILDSRPRRFPDELEEGSDYVPPPGTGLRLTLDGRHAIGLPEQANTNTDDGEDRDHWVGYGADAGAFVDVTGLQRVVGLSALVQFADPVGDAPDIPITEQIRLGGRFPMTGALPGRLVGRSAAVAEFSYQWPVWVWMDGEAFYEVGNVFGPHLDGFELPLLRSSFGLGVRSTSSRDNVFRITLAMLTETFEDGHGFDALRFTLGATNGLL